MIESAIVQILRDDSGVGAIADDRIYLMMGPQEANATFCVITSIGGSRELYHDGETGVANRMIQVSCISDKVSTVKLLADAVRKALHDFRGIVTPHTIFYASVQNEVDISGPDYGFQVAIDVEVSFTEA